MGYEEDVYEGEKQRNKRQYDSESQEDREKRDREVRRPIVMDSDKNRRESSRVVDEANAEIQRNVRDTGEYAQKRKEIERVSRYGGLGGIIDRAKKIVSSKRVKQLRSHVDTKEGKQAAKDIGKSVWCSISAKPVITSNGSEGYTDKERQQQIKRHPDNAISHRSNHMSELGGNGFWSSSLSSNSQSPFDQNSGGIGSSFNWGLSTNKPSRSRRSLKPQNRTFKRSRSKTWKKKRY